MVSLLPNRPERGVGKLTNVNRFALCLLWKDFTKCSPAVCVPAASLS
jgi:hypothetical protein